MNQAGNTYKQISDWFNKNNYLTPRGAVFKANHAWSIHMKKNKSIDRFSRSFEPVIADMSVDITQLPQ